MGVRNVMRCGKVMENHGKNHGKAGSHGHYHFYQNLYIIMYEYIKIDHDSLGETISSRSRGGCGPGRLYVSGKALEQQSRLGSLGDPEMDIEMLKDAGKKKNGVPKKDGNHGEFLPKNRGHFFPVLCFIGL